MKNQLPILAGLLILGVATGVQGWWSERWRVHEGLDEMAGRITNVPMQIGAWKGERGEEQDASTLQVAGALNSLTRNYRDAQKESISLFMLYGRPAQIWIHTPDHCYPAAGFDSISTPTTERIETSVGVAEFGVSSFRKSDGKGGAQNLRVYWGYSANGEWLAPDNLKWAFGGNWGVYKMYVIVPVPNLADPSDEQNRVHAFIRDLLPEVNRTLFAESYADKAANEPSPGDNADPAAKANLPVANPPVAKAPVAKAAVTKAAVTKAAVTKAVGGAGLAGKK